MSTDSYRKCAKCGSTPIQDGILAFHRFPKLGKTNIERVRAWAKFCWPEENWSEASLAQLHKSNKVLCNRHFPDNCFTDNSKERLSKFATPLDRMEVTTSTVDQHCSQINIEHEIDCLHQPGSSSLNILAMDSQKITNKTSILKSLDIKKLEDLTPREKKLYKICTKRLKEIRRLRNELKSKKKADKLQKICEDINIKKLHDLKLSNNFIMLLQSQIKNCKRPRKARRYTIQQKIIALTLFKKSPGCYRLLRRMFALPCQSTLKKLLNRVPLETGINHHVFNSLKNMAEKHLSEENLCILSFDEMSIRRHLHYNEKIDMIEGYQDHGNHGRTKVIATNALVFMLTGIRKKWKQPIAFYFSGNTVTADRLSIIIKEILHECWKTGLTVVGTVCDLSRVNIKALDNLGSTREEPYFMHEGHEVVTILDPPHLLKCTRNLFLKHDIQITTNVQVNEKVVKGVAKWAYIQKFHDMDKNSPGFIFAPALTEQHLNPNSRQKMRVKLAAQVFSHSVTAGILAKIASNELPAEAHATATLLAKFDELFDALNADSRDLRGGKKYLTNMTVKSPHIGLFKDMRKFINELKFLGSNSPPPSQFGWIRTLNAVERLWKNLQLRGIKTLSTRRLNQDPLENCFGCIRYHCGSNNNPNITQFISGVKTAIISNMRHTGYNKNCEDDTAVLTDNLRLFLLSEPKEKNIGVNEKNIDLDLDPLITDATEAVEQATSEAQACAYVCGFIYKKIKNSNCSLCKKVFLASESAEWDKINLFVTFKEYDTMHKSLKYVNIAFVRCVEICSSVINAVLNEEAWRKSVQCKIMSALAQVNFDFLQVCPDHFEKNKNKILISSFHISVKRYCVLKNREFEDEEKCKSLKRKMSILKNK